MRQISNHGIVMCQVDVSLQEAGILRNAGAQRCAVNRAYYVLLALLATKQLGISRHSGAISTTELEWSASSIEVTDVYVSDCSNHPFDY